MFVRIPITLASILLFCLKPHLCSATSEGKLGALSDTVCIFTPAIAFSSSLLLEPAYKTNIFAGQFVLQELFVEGAKNAFAGSSFGERPSGGKMGAISSHVSATTAGAIKLWQLYPDNYWMKAASASSIGLVAYQRIQGDHHTSAQVGLGIFTAFTFDYFGQKVTDWYSKTTNQKIDKHNSLPISFSMDLTEKGDGLIGLIQYTF